MKLRISVKLMEKPTIYFVQLENQWEKSCDSGRVVGFFIPRRGIASDTLGKASATMLWNTVSERRIVTPENN